MQIAILLATYNGEQHISCLLDSLIAQSNHLWHLYIHDDASTDHTIHIVQRYRDHYPELITVLDYPPQGGAAHNFMSILRRVNADYYMFCDQDDIWHEDKVEHSFQQIKAIEKIHPDCPLIVHSDLRVIDRDGNTLATSFWQKAGMHPDMFKTFSQRITNVVTGCTMLFNQHAKEAALRLEPYGRPLHDEWVTIRTCAEGGIVVPIFEQLIDYRQHESNTLGAEACYNRKTPKYYLTHLKRIWKENCDNYQVLRSGGYGSVATYLVNKIRNMIVYHLKY